MPPSVGSVEIDEFDLLLGLFLAGEVVVDDVLPAHPVAVLFLDGADDHDPIALGIRSRSFIDLGAVDGGGHAALLVGAASAEDHVLRLISLVGVSLPVAEIADAYGIDMRVDGDDLFALAHPADDVAQAVDLYLIKAQLLHLGLDAQNDFLFFTALTGVRDHLPQETGHICLIASGCCLDRFKIHNRTLHLNCCGRWLPSVERRLSAFIIA